MAIAVLVLKKEEDDGIVEQEQHGGEMKEIPRTDGEDCYVYVKNCKETTLLIVRYRELDCCEHMV